jgi:hypothetical protein
MKYSFTKEQIQAAADQSSSKTEMMRVLKIRQSGGGYQSLLNWCKKYDIIPPDGLAIGRANVDGHKFVAMSNEDWFVDGVQRQSGVTIKRLVALGVPYICSTCGQPPEWNGLPLRLQIDHINGDRWDNRIENVRVICPNCHTQTETYANNGTRKSRYYCECGTEIWKLSTYCKKCATQKTPSRREGVIDWPPVAEVVEKVRLTNFTQYAIVLGVSDNAIRKYLQRSGIDPKSLRPVA